MSMDLAARPRRRYMSGPTPIRFLPRLTEALGGPRIYIKRDDTLDLLGGGSKTRKLEFLMADAIERGADTIITSGAVQSNHCRLTLSATGLEGLACHLVLGQPGGQPYDPAAGGNAFLYRLLGVAGITLVGQDGGIEATAHAVAERLRAQGRHPYVIPGGGSNGIGGLGYAACAQEILWQGFDMGIAFAAVVVATGSGGTQAGLLAGFGTSRADLPVIGVSVGRSAEAQVETVAAVLAQVGEALGEDPGVPRSAIRCTDAYVGPGYGEPTAAMIEAVELVARLEGILLDPVYTGKAMAGLIGMVREGRFPPHARVLFLHTGGAPGLYARTAPFLAHWQADGAH
jgi:D-cysteine desulfhydrase